MEKNDYTSDSTYMPPSPKKIFIPKNFTQIVRLSFVDLRWAQLYVILVHPVFNYILFKKQTAINNEKNNKLEITVISGWPAIQEHP